MTACSGFTQYAYAFLQVDAELSDAPEARRRRRSRHGPRHVSPRAGLLRARARSDGTPAHGRGSHGIRSQCLASATKADVPALYWTAVAWGGELSLADNQLVRLGEIVTVRALLTRALELDETWQDGAIDEAIIALDGLPRLLGGNPRTRPGTFRSRGRVVEREIGVCLRHAGGQRCAAGRRIGRIRAAAARRPGHRPTNRPSLRLANLVAQRRARFLLSRIDKLF